MHSFVSQALLRRHGAQPAPLALPDHRPHASRLHALQAMMINSPSQQKLVQRKTIAGLKSGAPLANGNTVHFNDGEADVATLWMMPQIDGATRAEALRKIAMAAGALGAEIDTKVNGNWTFELANGGKSKVPSYDPLRARFSAQYQDGGGAQRLTLDYHFGSTWSGYVIHVTDTGWD